MSFFSKTPNINTDSAKIRELLTRGVENIYPNKEALEKELASGRRLTLYLGIDPTGNTLHLGHIIPLLKLRQFQELGHKIILLIGDFTGMIGDPTGKNATRKKLTREEVLENAKLYKEQAGRIIRFDGENKAELRHNSEWLGKLSYTDFYELSALITTEQLIKRDMFEKRQKEGKPIYLHEFMYPLLQGYDSMALGVDGEVGGNDQTFNMLVGRDLAKKINKKEKFVLATKLLTDSAGAKMGKTEGNMVAFSDTPADCFGKVMRWPDLMILSGFELCTRVESFRIDEIKSQLASGTNPKDAKLHLAEAVAALLHGADTAARARAGFEATFSTGDPADFLKIALDGKTVADALVAAGVVSSKGDLRRLIAEGAVSGVGSGEKAGEEFMKNAALGKYRIGKHRFIEIT